VQRVTFCFPLPTLPRKTTLFDLEITCAGRNFLKPGSVAVQHPRGQYHVALATDIHVASRWDEFAEGFADVFGDAPKPSDGGFDYRRADGYSREVVLNTYTNPNRNLGWFISKLNDLASRDEIDALIVSGDLVDYKYKRSRSQGGTSYSDTEWQFLHDLLLGITSHGPRLTVPLFTSTGNHDYRLYPYRLHTYGIKHTGIPDEICERYSRGVGDWGKLKYSFGDLDAVRVSSGPDHSLDYYYRDFNPFADFELSLGGVSFIVLDTGPDAATNGNHLLSKRFKRYFTRAFNISDPSSDGYCGEQILYLESWRSRCSKKAAVVVTHAPLVAPRLDRDPDRAADNNRVLFTVSPSPDQDTLKFENYLSERSLDVSCIFRNQLPVFQFLRQHSGSTTYFSGHSHRHANLILDKQSGDVMLADQLHSEAHPVPMPRAATLFSTPSLGHISTTDARFGSPSYRTIAIEDQDVKTVSLNPVVKSPLDEWIYEWRCERETNDIERLDFWFVQRGEREVASALSHRLILVFSGRSPKGLSIQVPDDRAVVFSQLRLSDPDPYACWVLRESASFRILVRNRHRETRIGFLYETLVGEASSGLRWHFRVL
jgi:hypothetical protein